VTRWGDGNSTSTKANVNEASDLLSILHRQEIDTRPHKLLARPNFINDSEKHTVSFEILSYALVPTVYSIQSLSEGNAGRRLQTIGANRDMDGWL
jgi:hypothetical protein